MHLGILVPEKLKIKMTGKALKYKGFRCGIKHTDMSLMDANVEICRNM